MNILKKIENSFRNLFLLKPAPKDPLASDLKRCLGLADLTFLSLGATIGSGIYVTTGQITLMAGPSMVLSYFLAGVASFLSALCYADLAARFPIAGSSYQFTYMTMGEFLGFFVGWNIALEHAVGAASCGRAFSAYIDSLFDERIAKFMSEHLPMAGGVVATYPDFVGSGVVIICVVLVASGIKLSSYANIFFTASNLLVCIFILVSAAIIGSPSNWNIPGHGGFFPHGVSATISGAATLIYSYVGYEVIAATAEEAKKPNRNIPLSLIISISVATVIYVSVAAAFISLAPWYQASPISPFGSVYISAGWRWAKYLVTAGILLATIATIISLTIAIPRYLFAMARDGLLCGKLESVNAKTGVPVIGTIVSGCLTVLLDLIFSLPQLINFMSIGQLISCIFVAASVIKLRYQPLKIAREEYTELSEYEVATCSNAEHKESSSLLFSTSSLHASAQEDSERGRKNVGRIRRSIIDSNYGWMFAWTSKFESGTIHVFLLFFGIVVSAAAISMFLFANRFIATWWFVLLASVFVSLAAVCLISMSLFTQDETIETYKIPFAPFTPFLSIIINLTLLMKLGVNTWVRLGVWMFIGLIIYFSYGYRHSKARNANTTLN